MRLIDWFDCLLTQFPAFGRGSYKRVAVTQVSDSSYINQIPCSISESIKADKTKHNTCVRPKA